MSDPTPQSAVEELHRTMAGHVGAGGVPGLVWLVAHAGEVHSGCAGVLDLETNRPVTRSSIFRISSTTKPITAACAMTLVDDGIIGLDDPVIDLLPELADREVLAVPGGPLDDTVPAARDITLRDLLTFRLGLGGDFTGAPQPAMEDAASRGLPVGPPRPAESPDADEYLRLVGSVPLEHQPGARWLYHLGADVAGVLIGRACGTTFGAALRERIFGPLGMTDTGFFVPDGDLDRFGAHYWAPEGERVLFDPSEGQWSAPPPFGGGGAGLVSTVDDLLAFAEMLRDGGPHTDEQGSAVRVLSPGSVAEMITDQLTAEQRATGPGPDEAGLGWGLGMAVQIAEVPTRAVGGFGWDGGLGSTWSVDPSRDLVAILLTNEAWASPEPTAVHQEFLRGAVRLTGDVRDRSE
jgi:CubicO group peptidase (beta-lactamase class C family)